MELTDPPIRSKPITQSQSGSVPEVMKMNSRSVEAAPQLYARAGGALYLAIIIIGLWGEAFVRNRLIVSGDAASTAANILAHESLWRVHIGAELLLLVFATTLAMIEYVLLRPVSREFALLAVFFDLVSVAIEAAVAMYLIQALFPLDGAQYLKAFTPDQLAALARMTVRSHGYGFGVSLIFFGCSCIVTGWLIFRSGYLPKFVGVLMQIAGVCYLLNSFALIVSPTLADRLYPAVLLPPFIAELSFCLWLLIMGVNVRRWKERVVPALSGSA